jgi:UDP-N-acetyl-2-amino-2-deoxyglucuronate dehydrogenase
MYVKRSPVTGRKVRFAVAGCGRIASNHFQAIAKHSDRCVLTDVCDVDGAALAAAQLDDRGLKG